MPLVSKQFSGNMKSFILELNQMKQEDAEKAIDRFCNKLEEEIDRRVKSITITIPPGYIQVQGSPSAQINAAPIILKGVVS